MRSTLFHQNSFQRFVIPPPPKFFPLRALIPQANRHCIQLTSFETGRLIIASESESTTKTANVEQGYRAVGIMDHSRRTSGVRALSGTVNSNRGPSTGHKDEGRRKVRKLRL